MFSISIIVVYIRIYSKQIRIKNLMFYVSKRGKMASSQLLTS